MAKSFILRENVKEFLNTQQATCIFCTVVNDILGKYFTVTFTIEVLTNHLSQITVDMFTLLIN